MPSTRRSFLASTAAAVPLVAGCATFSRSPEPDDPPPAGDTDLPDRDRHVFGANGEWSSFGANAANNRQVADGEAPVDGVTEQWRAPFPALSHAEPVVADGTVYASTVDAVRALDAESGERLWERTLETPGEVTAPSTYAGDQLVCGAGERVVSLAPESGDVRWTQDVFGQVLDHPAFLSGHWSVVATEAGRVYLLGPDGVGAWQWQLPAPPMAPPAVDAESVYVNCRDGGTYALGDGDRAEMRQRWRADTGWAPGGVALVDGLAVVADGGSLEAVDTESGSRAWREPIGDWPQTAPTVARDTVFVGGDALYAFDPTPGGDPAGGPAKRFEHSFAGRVGPGPVLDDGTLYVAAEVDDGEVALVALA